MRNAEKFSGSGQSSREAPRRTLCHGCAPERIWLQRIGKLHAFSAREDRMARICAWVLASRWQALFTKYGLRQSLRGIGTAARGSPASSVRHPQRLARMRRPAPLGVGAHAAPHARGPGHVVRRGSRRRCVRGGARGADSLVGHSSGRPVRLRQRGRLSRDLRCRVQPGTELLPTSDGGDDVRDRLVPGSGVRTGLRPAARLALRVASRYTGQWFDHTRTEAEMTPLPHRYHVRLVGGPSGYG